MSVSVLGSENTIENETENPILVILVADKKTVNKQIKHNSASDRCYEENPG